MHMWVANMIICLGIGFGCFGYAIYLTMAAEEKKKKAAKAP